MNGYNFSQDVREALAQARREADALRHDYVGTEHVLLGIVANPECIGGSLLKWRGVGAEQIRDRIASIVKRGADRPPREDLPYTSRAKRILELAMTLARELDHPEVNTGHLFLGVLREEKGIGAGVLGEFGFTIGDTVLEFGRMARAGRSETRPEERPRPSDGRRAAAMLRSMTASPRVAEVFARHGIDVEALVRDLTADDQTS
jgi:ATP-dependent Clp protease ATP-binding subunit ClpC